MGSERPADSHQQSAGSRQPEGKDADLVFRGGTIVDGTGRLGFEGDLAVQGGRIVGVGGHLGPAAREIDARGLLVCPGFIDAHTHSDLTLLVNPQAESSVHQGVTTEVVGNCGLSFVHAAPTHRAALMDNIYATLQFDDWDWQTVAGYRARLERERPSINVVPMAGHATLRANVMGLEPRQASPIELSEMLRQLDQALAEGAAGLTTGLTYVPACYADLDELVALGRVVRDRDGLFAFHMRGQAAGLIPAVAEVLEVGRQSGVAVQISHHGAFGRDHWAKVPATLEMIDAARAEGLDVTYDVVPTREGLCALTSTLPPWAVEGGRQALLQRLQDSALRARCKKDWQHGLPDWQGYVRPDWETWTLTEVASAENQHLSGKTMAEAARERGQDPWEMALDLILEEEGHVGMASWNKSHEQIELLLRHPAGMVSGDAYVVAPYGLLGRSRPHWRSYGLYPYALRTYVRERGALSWEGAVQRMTSVPASRFGLHDRGVLSEGYAADVVAFDAERLQERATFADPHQFPEGVEWVLVNGEVVIQHGEHTGARPGMVLPG